MQILARPINALSKYCRLCSIFLTINKRNAISGGTNVALDSIGMRYHQHSYVSCSLLSFASRLAVDTYLEISFVRFRNRLTLRLSRP